MVKRVVAAVVNRGAASNCCCGDGCAHTWRDMMDIGFPSVSDFGGKSFNSQEVSELLGQ